MKHYAVAELTVADPAWIEPYVRAVTAMVERHGGRYLARTSRIERLEGSDELPQVVLILEWPSREAALAFYDSDEYRPFRDSRLAGASGHLLLVAARDDTGQARIG